MSRIRRPVPCAPVARAVRSRPLVTEPVADFDLDLNPGDDPDAGYAYVDPASLADTEGSEAIPPGW